MADKKKLEQFCFDVLGDFIYPELDCIIDSNRVIVTRLRGVPAEVIRDTWDREVKGTEFEQVSLYL